MQDSPTPQDPKPTSKPPYLFLIPVAVGLLGFVGYQTVRMGTETGPAHYQYVVDTTSATAAVIQNGVITVHPHANAAPQQQRVAAAEPKKSNASPAASPSPAARPSASAAPAVSPSPGVKPSPTHAPKVADKPVTHPAHHAVSARAEELASQPVPHIHPLPSRPLANVNVSHGQETQSTSESATAPPITDAPSVRTNGGGAAVEPAKPVQVAEAPHAEPPAVINASDRVVDAKMTFAASPEYPEIARDQGVRGTSVVFVTVDPAGAIVHISIASSSGNSVLDRSAVSAARSSRYVPPKVDGRPATETYRVTYDFAP